jgi:hypothetical protein
MLNVRDGDRTIVYCYVILYFRKTLSCVPSHHAHKLLSSSLTSNVMPNTVGSYGDFHVATAKSIIF